MMEFLTRVSINLIENFALLMERAGWANRVRSRVADQNLIAATNDFHVDFIEFFLKSKSEISKKNIQNLK
jgi:hypothetical protein